MTTYTRSGLFHIYNVNPITLKFQTQNGFFNSGISFPDMPCSAARIIDYNNDLWPDFLRGTPDYIQNGPNHPWLIENQSGTMSFDVSPVSIDVGSHYYGGYLTSDYDKDGDLDILSAIATWTNQRLFMNNSNGTFTDLTATYGMSSYYGRDQGIAWTWIDYDNDGDEDLIGLRANGGAGIFFYRNDFTDGNFLTAKFVNNNGIVNNIPGLYVEMYSAGHDLYLTVDETHQRSFNFGLGVDTQVDSLVIHWPGGGRTKRENIAANQFLTIRECDAQRSIEFTAPSIAYVEPGHPEIMPVVVDNASCNPITISSMTCTSQAWTLPVAPVVVASRGQIVLNLEFNPSAYGQYTGVLSLYANTDTSNTEDALRTDIALEAYAGPIFPAIQDLNISIDGNQSALLSWTPLTQTIYGNAASPDYYIVYYNENDPNSSADWYYQGAAFSGGYTHLFAARHATTMNYRVMAYRGLPSALARLQPGMTQVQVESVLRANQYIE